MSLQSEHTLPRILVVDDEPGICLAISLLLQDLYDVVTAETVGEALAKLDGGYALILLDLRMPGVKNYELLDTTRQRAENTPIAIFSAMGDKRTADEVRQHGAVAMIEKPFSRQELLQRIDEILSAQPVA